MAGPLEVQNDKSAGAPAVMRGSEATSLGAKATSLVAHSRNDAYS